ncbi:PIR Superfamily Protein [Plasmodium ovale wallikeri]|uniref:PIR Superfamily Protein n=1 Tax=Plasmodium ovale wallikeri TaxID=864142 RepID=A0A1A9AD50_PLAOA|nr:PIR Superfamily Protein [Plasmodium ovale wallikeri]
MKRHGGILNINYKSYFPEALKLGNKKNEIKENCRKLAYNVKKIPELVLQEQEDDELCDHLNFWLYGQLHKIISYTEASTQI